jgi:hypothetical protein
LIRAATCILPLVMATISLAAADEQLAGLAEVKRSAAVQSVVDRTAERTHAEFAAKELKPEQLAITLVDLTDPAAIAFGSYHGDAQIYPASVIKLFYLAAAHRWMEDGKLQDSEELRRAMRDMIVQSYNEARGYVVDVLTGTTSGPELADDALRVVGKAERRSAVFHRPRLLRHHREPKAVVRRPVRPRIQAMKSSFRRATNSPRIPPRASFSKSSPAAAFRPSALSR